MKPKLLLIAFILFSSIGYSQLIEIRGKIVDSTTGISLPGVNIKQKNSNNNVSSDIDGNFVFYNLNSGSTIVFSFIGYKNYELKVSKSEKINVFLNEDTKSLEEVVVLGYSSKKKKYITGAVAVLSSKTIQELRPIKVEQALQGTVSGLTVTAQSGAPGAGLNIRIRGVGTNGKPDATVLIDGSIGDLSILNPEDIESITVLKDAQAAIYGTLGANGIVIVTTKQGKKNSKTKVTFNNYTGFQETTKELKLLDATEYALLLNESYANGGQALPYTNVSGLGTGTNWQKEVFNKAPIINSDFTVSGGSDKITYALSASDLKQEGIIGQAKSGFKRNTARLALGIDLSPKFKVQSNFIYTYVNRKSLSENGLGSVLFNALNTASVLPTRDLNGNYTLVPVTGYGVEVINPLAQIENTYNDYDLKKLNGNVKLTYDVVKNFKITSRIGFNTSNSNGKSFSKIVNYGGKVFDVTRSSVSQNKINDNDYTFDLFGEYEKTFFGNHKIKATIGTTVYKQFGSGLFATGYDVPNNSWDYADISLAQGFVAASSVGSYKYDERRLSHFAFLDYSYKGKYLISGTIRRDLSTKFGPNKRVAIFPGVTAGWLVTEESFLKKSNFLNFLKVRGSYGVLGNDQIPNNSYIGSLTNGSTYVFDGNLVNGTAIGVLPNPYVQWEEAKKFDVGFDLKILNEKIDITSDYFDETRSSLLLIGVPVSGITGVGAPGSGAPTKNAGKLNNKGIEFAINYKDKLSKNFNFGIGYNITKLKNEVLDVNNSTGYEEGGSFGVGQPRPTRMQVGHPIGYFYGLQQEGIFQNQAEINAAPSQSGLGSGTAPGDIRFKDVNGDGKIDLNDRTQIGKPLADITMGLNISLNYKNLDFIAYSYASIGNDMIRNYERVSTDVNKLNYVLGRWTGEGTSNTVPRVTTGATNNTLFSSYYVEDASFLRIQNVQLGYTLNKNVSEKIGISKLRFYTSVNNVYTFTKYRGYDPAASNGALNGNGIDNGFYPTPRTYMFGINLNF